MPIPRPVVRVAFMAMLSLTPGACRAPGASNAASPAARPAYISHIVFVKLLDPADRTELLGDADRLLAPIPGVVSYAAGEHLDTGRDTIITDYDVGMYIGFDSAARYAAYVEHPDHVAFVTKWGPRLEWLRVFDVADPTP